MLRVGVQGLFHSASYGKHRLGEVGTVYVRTYVGMYVALLAPVRRNGHANEEREREERDEDVCAP